MIFSNIQLNNNRGFTLIELSIVLIIVGLIVGGALVGKDLVEASQLRSQISQVEQVKIAVKTFKLKYNCLAGDCAKAEDFGLKARGIYAGQGDGNNIIEGVWATGANRNQGCIGSAGEIPLFWIDLSSAGMIPGSFSIASADTPSAVATSALPNYIPPAKIGGGNSLYIWSQNSTNYIGLSAMTSFTPNYSGGKGLKVSHTYSIDTKIDDGLPKNGTVKAMYCNGTGGRWAEDGDGSAITVTNYGATVPASPTTCYHGIGTWAGGSGTGNYSLTENNGEGVNCALSFQIE